LCPIEKRNDFMSKFDVMFSKETSLARTGGQKW
jgi:hypothetical protein